MQTQAQKANSLRTKLLLIINNEILGFQKCITKVNSISFTEQVNKFNNIEITFHNPVETGTIETNQLFDAYNSVLDKSFSTITDNSTPNSEYVSLGCGIDKFKLQRKLCSRRKGSNFPYDELRGNRTNDNGILNTLMNSPTEENEKTKTSGENSEKAFRENLSFLREFASTLIKRKKKTRNPYQNKSTKIINTKYKDSISSLITTASTSNKTLSNLTTISPKKKKKKHKTVGLSNPQILNLKDTHNSRMPLKSVDCNDKFSENNIFNDFKNNHHYKSRLDLCEESGAIEENEEDYKNTKYSVTTKNLGFIRINDFIMK